MTESIRFHLDENVDSAIADGLRRRGLNVTVPNDVGLIGASDEEQLAFAMREQRVLFTHDDDFLTMAHCGAEHWGIIYCHPESRSIGQILGGLLLIHDCLNGADCDSCGSFGSRLNGADCDSCEGQLTCEPSRIYRRCLETSFLG